MSARLADDTRPGLPSRVHTRRFLQGVHTVKALPPRKTPTTSLPTRYRSHSFLLLFAASTCAVVSLAATALAWPVKAVPGTQDRLRKDIKYLSSDALEGRGVGTKGLNLAADYIREQFKANGLDISRVDGQAFQPFTMVTDVKLGSPNTLTLVGPKKRTISLKQGTDFEVCAFGGSGKIKGDLVFLGYSIDAPGAHYSDLKGIDVKGKVVVIMRRTPRQSDSDGPFAAPHGGISQHASLRSKVSNAFGAGAGAILFVNDPHSNRQNAQQELKRARDAVVSAAVTFDGIGEADKDKLTVSRRRLASAVKRLADLQKKQKQGPADPLMSFGYARSGNSRDIPIVHITHQALDKVLKVGLKTSLAKLEAAIDKDFKSRSQVVSGWHVQLETSITTVRTEVKNVIGVLEGEGPLKDETIVIGAHYDHVGLGGPGSLAPGSKEVHNGADDNASGTVSLIELARRLSARKTKLPRRLVFIAFTAEELGLIGSARYVANPVFPLDKTIAMFNMDMVGRLRDKRLTVFGTGTAPRWKKLLEVEGKRHEFALSMKPSGFGPSDHSSFYGKKIPVLHFFTGTHSDYHRPGDDWPKINFGGIEQIVGMIEDMVLATANTKTRPKYIEIASRARVNRSGSRPYFGSIPDFASDAKGYSLSGVAPGSPAAKGGLKGGDLIVGLGTAKIGGLDDFDLALRKYKGGDVVAVTLIRDGKRKTLKVTLAKPR